MDADYKKDLNAPSMPRKDFLDVFRENRSIRVGSSTCGSLSADSIAFVALG